MVFLKITQRLHFI